MQKNILDYLEDTACKYPDKTAYSDGITSLTFSEVKEEAKSVGSYIANKGIYGEPIAVCMSRGPMAITAYYSIIYSGNIYVPIDMNAPLTHIQGVLDTLGTKLVICDKRTVDKASKLRINGTICQYEDMYDTPVDEEKLKNIYVKQKPEDMIYIVYTSGSTGEPKGVMAAHKSVIDYAEQLTKVMNITADTVFGCQAPLFYDACLKEMLTTIKTGATTYIVPTELFSCPVKLISFLDEHRVNTICFVVTAMTIISSLGTFNTCIPKYIHTVAFGGEVMPVNQLNLWRKALPDATFINLYGPTEATGMSCYYVIDREFNENESIPIGKAFDNTYVTLYDKDSVITDVYREGEICISGASLTLGYYKDEEKTNERFVAIPGTKKEKMYRTGDIGFINEHGELVYICRKDNMFKHMGHRVEPGEIEAVAQSINGIGRACCVYDEEHKRIKLYYTGNVDKDELRLAMKERLPRYMVPGVISSISNIPLMPNGKIDRRKF